MVMPTVYFQAQGPLLGVQPAAGHTGFHAVGRSAAAADVAACWAAPAAPAAPELCSTESFKASRSKNKYY